MIHGPDVNRHGTVSLGLSVILALAAWHRSGVRDTEVLKSPRKDHDMEPLDVAYDDIF